MEYYLWMFYRNDKSNEIMLIPKGYNIEKNKYSVSEQSEMEHVKDYTIAENLSKQNKVSAFHVSTFKRLRRSTSL